MPRRKALKVIVDIHLQAITCPGVFLPEQNDVFVYVELLGQRKRTEAMPPVFPFLFHEKLRFDKVFTHCTDPVQIASALSGESVRIELVQLTYPAGELLATYEDNAREFLFPTPRASPSYPGVDREVLLRRSSSFPGIAPKLEFSSRTVIKEVTSVAGSGHSARRKKEKGVYEADLGSRHQFETPPIESSTPHPSINGRPASSKKKPNPNRGSSTRSGRSKARSSSMSRASTQWGYEQSTIASRARSPSPYTRRRMAQLSVKDPFDSAIKSKPFKTELDGKPEFVVRKATRDCLSFDKSPPLLPRVSPASEQRRKSPSHRSISPSRRKQTPGPSRCYQSGDFGSDESELRSSVEEVFSSHRSSGSSRDDRSREWRSEFSRPIRSPCCLEGSAYEKEFDSDLKWYTKRKSERVKCERDIHQRQDALAPLSRNYSDPTIPVRGRERAKRLPGRVTFKNTAELISSSGPQRRRRSGSGSRPTSARSAPESTPRPRTPRRDLSFSRADLEPEVNEVKSSGVDPESILHRRPLRERFSTGEPSPYEKIRDRVRDLLSSPRANRILDESISEANERYWRRRSHSPSPRTSPRCAVNVALGNGEYWNERGTALLGKSHRRAFEENIDKIYDGIYSDLRKEDS